MWGFLVRGLNELVAIPTSMVLARLLTPHDFGVAAAAAFFVQIAQRMTNFGFNTALIQLKEVTPAHTSTVFLVNMATGVLVCLALTFGAPFLGDAFRSPDAAAVLPVVGLTFVIGPISGIPAALLVRDLRFKEATALEWLATCVTAATSLTLAFLGFGYWSLVYSQVIGVAVPSLARLWVTGWWPSFRFSRAALRELLGFGMGLHAKRLLDAVAQNLDNLVVGRMLGVGALGVYDKSFTMMNRAVTLLSSAGPSVSFRVLAIISDDDDRFRLAYRKVLLASTFIAYPVFAGLIMVAPELFLFMFGSQWNSAVGPFRILCVVGALKFVNGYASTATQSKGRVWGEVWRQATYIVLIVIGAGLGSSYGLAGASVGVLSATAIMSFAMHDFLLRATSVKWGDVLAAQVPSLACALGVCVCLSALREGLRSYVPFAISPPIFLASSAGVACLYLLGFIRFNPFTELAVVLHQTVTEFAPGLAGVLVKPVRDGRASAGR